MSDPDVPSSPEPDDPGRGRAAEDGRFGPVRFVSDFRYVLHRFDDLAPVLLDPGAGWVHRLARNGSEDTSDGVGQGRSALMLIGLAGHRSGIPAIVTVGSPRQRAGTVVVPIRWLPFRYARVLPELDADLELSYVSDTACRMALSGRYRAPMGGVGQHLDQMALHRVAESSVRSFLHRCELALVESSERRARHNDVSDEDGGGLRRPLADQT
jgi:hypothetical protein